MMPSSKWTCTGWLQSPLVLVIFQTSRVPAPLLPAAVASVESSVATEVRRGSMPIPALPSVLMVQGASSVPSARPNSKVWCRALASRALSATESRLMVRGIMGFFPAT